MAKLRVETSTGSVYFIDTDNRRWAKNSYFWEPLNDLAVGEWSGNHQDIPDFENWERVDIPEVGKNMYIKGQGFYDWWLSTPIVEVREVEEWE